ncbi:MAG TPA: DnaA/Hda family protein [Planctomycetaceae bacterium]|jgi:chromosomal replication initiator protein|nr:DnaA/Hda family protein [Planctomycetaceae bacterium]
MARTRNNSDRPTASPSEPLVLLKENRLAHSAANRLFSTGEEDGIWLVYLYGPAGVGKSHLVRHFVREARRKTPRRQVICETATEFLEALAQAYSRQDRVEFQQRYTEADLFVLEDLAPLQGRLPAQRMLIAILDDLKRAGGRVLVTCATRPGGLEKMLPRLINRLRGGLCVPLELLGGASRLGFAKHVAASRQIPLSAQAASLLAEGGPETPRELLAALVNVDLRTRQGLPESDDSLMRAHLKTAHPTRAVPLPQIAAAVAEFFKIPASELRTKDRPKRSILPRQIAMLLARELSRRPAGQIAQFFGRKNHTTVVHACRRTRHLLTSDPALGREVERMRRTLGRG